MYPMQGNSVLKTADIFYKLSDDQLENIASISTERTYRYGEVIFEENSGGDELFLIAQGEVEIQVDPNLVDPDTLNVGPVESIVKLQRGQSFGEIALVDRGTRSASAQAAADETKVIVIPRQGLIDLCDNDPQLGYRLMRNLAADLSTKLRKTDLYLRELFLDE
jgi:CRP-like cAMP-binding protein